MRNDSAMTWLDWLFVYWIPAGLMMAAAFLLFLALGGML
jgi:hypothetical protein